MSAHIQPSSAHTQTHKQSKQEQSEPCWQRMVQLCIKEDKEVRNYSNCASCHNSNMAMHMLYPINQETATFALAPSCILATGGNNLTKLVTTQKQKKWVCLLQTTNPTGICGVNLWFYITWVIYCHQVGWENNLTNMWQLKFGELSMNSRILVFFETYCKHYVPLA